MKYDGNQLTCSFSIRLSDNMQSAIATVCNKRGVSWADFVRSAILDALAKELYLVENGKTPEQMVFDGEKVVAVRMDHDYIDTMRTIVNGH